MIKRLPLNLQFFAEEAPAEIVEAESTTVEVEAPEPQEEKKTFTEDQLEKIVKDRLARAEKDKQKAVQEAEKLAKMNADEKQKYEFEKLQTELAELRKKDAYYGLSKEATKMLAGADIVADDELLGFVVKDTAEDTQAAVNAFVSIVEAKVDAAVKDKLKGTPPKRPNGQSGALTKSDIMAMKDGAERIKAIQSHPHLFK